MNKVFLFCAMFCFLALLSGCKYAHGDGPDVATRPAPGKASEHNPRKSNWLTGNLHRERVGRGDINKPGGNDDFQVFPHRDKIRRSEKLRGQSSPFFWR